MALSHGQLVEADELLTNLLEEEGADVLDVWLSAVKPVFTVTVRGSRVGSNVFNACEQFGFERVLSVEACTWTPDVGDCVIVTFMG